jgi:alkanesulfonate monooxygenase SsuD/methylene tetrahydromethanopterin reductase-like flavin-dependent oxidoreductase (luciferase family)
MLAIIGGLPARFAPLTELYRQATAQFGFPDLPIGVHSPGHVAATDEQAIEEFWPHYQTFLLDVRRSRGFPTITREFFDREVATGSLYVGSPETVAQRIATSMDVLGANRFDLKYGMGPMPHSTIMENLRLFGTEVAPRVRELLGVDADSRSATPVR